MKRLILMLCVTLSLTACSGPDSSGGVALSKDPYPTNAEFPHGQCNDTHAFADYNTGCGWVSANGGTYYIEPGAILAGANLTHTGLYHANLTGANLAGADLAGADLSATNLRGADLSATNLSGANLTGADLAGADLSATNLSGADLSATNLSGADLSATNLSGADLSGAKGNSMTVCPDGSNWGTAGNDCGF